MADKQRLDWDLVSLGEVMLRFDPGNTRIRRARTFEVSEGGGEYNVARGLSRCFGLRTAIVTALVDNEIGRLVEELIMAGGVSTSLIQWGRHDGLGLSARNGLNFTERGFGVRGALGVSDRGHTAVAGLRPGDVDFDRLFSEVGVRWFHTGGIFAALSESTAAVAEDALTAARRHGVTTSFDLNYRPSLWEHRGGPTASREVNQRLAPLVDVILGNEEDFKICLGVKVEAPEDLSELDPAAFLKMIDAVREMLREVGVIATTLREVQSASTNCWGAVAWSRTEGAAVATKHAALEIYDRVGGGDSFASGLIYGLMQQRTLHAAVELGAAHGALAMTTPGDTSMATLAEVESLAMGGAARVKR